MKLSRALTAKVTEKQFQAQVLQLARLFGFR
jgi:hypothetical protein